MKNTKNLSLGKNTTYNYDAPNKEILEAVSNPHQDLDYAIRFSSPEFTSICPITGQPDFANIIIDYVPSAEIVESKSLKLYLVSYRNHGAFHEDCTVQIAKDIIARVKPKWLRIQGFWYPRGGIPIDVFFQTGEVPSGVFVKDDEVKLTNREHFGR
jgi:7-cyano-7-deazaguanine reductase